jgi:hypothetical protein
MNVRRVISEDFSSVDMGSLALQWASRPFYRELGLTILTLSKILGPNRAVGWDYLGTSKL